jgi:hypothetical protein
MAGIEIRSLHSYILGGAILLPNACQVASKATLERHRKEVDREELLYINLTITSKIRIQNESS